MLKKLLSTTALCVIPFAAGAADLPVRPPVYKAPAVVAPVYNWTGFYAGGNIGYSWGRSDVTIDSVEVFGIGAGGGATRLHPKGVIGGLQAGYNWQPSRNWVWGLETDFQWSGQKHSKTESGSFSATDVIVSGDSVTGTASATVTSKLTWLGTARGRVGFVADSNPGILWYGTGGLAYGRVKTSLVGSATGTYTDTSNCEGGCPFSGNVALSSAKTKLGVAVGGGAEGDLGNYWTWKIEYLYVDLGKVNGVVPVLGTACAGSTCTSFTGTAIYSNKMTDNIVRIGLNRRFGGP
jgi:outer membrane immunogenic protein